MWALRKGKRSPKLLCALWMLWEHLHLTALHCTALPLRLCDSWPNHSHRLPYQIWTCSKSMLFVLPILTASLIHFSSKGWENVRFEPILPILTTSLINFSSKGWENVRFWTNNHCLLPTAVRSAEAVGCFSDQKNDRSLKNLYSYLRHDIDWSNLRSMVEWCAEGAVAKGYRFFGVQFYGECWGEAGHNPRVLYKTPVPPGRKMKKFCPVGECSSNDKITPAITPAPNTDDQDWKPWHPRRGKQPQQEHRNTCGEILLVDWFLACLLVFLLDGIATCLIAWLIDCLRARSIACLIGLPACLISRLIDCLMGMLAYLPAWLIDCLIGLPACLIARLTDSLIELLIACLLAWLTAW